MKIIKRKAIISYSEKHADAKKWLEGFMDVAKAAAWQNLADVQKTYKRATSANVKSGSKVTIFRVKGDNYRLIVAIHYNTQRIYIRDFMTHEEYNNQLWKQRH